LVVSKCNGKTNVKQRDSPISPNYRNPEAKSKQVEIAMKKQMLTTRPYAIPENQTVLTDKPKYAGEKQNRRGSPKQPTERIGGEKEKTPTKEKRRNGYVRARDQLL